jgi:polyphosphate:AMP phosphotransferase
MFEAAELGSALSKEEYDARTPALRLDLINAQYDLRSADFPVIVQIAGDDLFGCNEVINLLHEWMDARYIGTHVFGASTPEELERPYFWRYWRALPRKGQLAIYASAWTLEAISARVTRRISSAELERRIAHIERFEQALGDDGILLVKLWLHLPKRELAKRLKKARKDRDWSWRVDQRDARIYQSYRRAMTIAQDVLRRTSTATACWDVIESTDTQYRNLTVGTLLLNAISERLNHERRAVHAVPENLAVAIPPPGGERILDSIDLSARLDYEDYNRRLAKYQARLSALSRKAQQRGLTTVVAFEGWDAAGKGGVIRRMARAMDARYYQLVPISAPTEEEKAHHYLWRFWKHLPHAGRTLVFDRCWYGRVLVERVEGYASEDEWKRGYAEINDFEAQLVEHGVALLKFWLHIDPDEQLRRFQAREQTGYKKYKITNEDYRNRDKRPLYEAAVEEMIARTSTDYAPWHLIAANDKRFARVQVLKTLCRRLAKTLG